MRISIALLCSSLLALSASAIAAPKRGDASLSERTVGFTSPATNDVAARAEVDARTFGKVCLDIHKILECAKKEGWLPDGNCECNPPPDGCQDRNQWSICFNQGKSCDSSCKCVCKPSAIKDCQEKHGQLQHDCSCLTSTYYKRRRDLDPTVRETMCPTGLTACPVDPTMKRPIYECLDTASSLDSCGGCASESKGTDCSALEGVDDVACVAGQCQVRQCSRGFEIAANGTSCIEVQDARGGSLLLDTIKAGSKIAPW